MVLGGFAFPALDPAVAQMKVVSGTLDIFGPCQTECASANFKDQVFAVGEMGNFGEGNRFANAYAEVCADAPCGFAEDE